MKKRTIKFLFEIIHQVRRKNGLREEYCSELLHYIDEQEKVGP